MAVISVAWFHLPAVICDVSYLTRCKSLLKTHSFNLTFNLLFLIRSGSLCILIDDLKFDLRILTDWDSAHCEIWKRDFSLYCRQHFDIIPHFSGCWKFPAKREDLTFLASMAWRKFAMLTYRLQAFTVLNCALCRPINFVEFWTITYLAWWFNAT